MEEKELKTEVSIVEEKAMLVKITSDAEYAEAADLVKQVKAAQKKVEDYWEPMRKSTYDAYKTVSSKKAEMVDPLKKAEKLIKGKISSYLLEVEKKKREEEEKLRKSAEEELGRKLAELEDAEKSGDFDKIEIALTNVSALQDAANSSVEISAPKASGVSTKKDWEIVSIDPSKVPIDVDGVEIRPVDEKAVIAFIRATKGKVLIPGVKFEEKAVVSVRV